MSKIVPASRWARRANAMRGGPECPRSCNQLPRAISGGSAEPELARSPDVQCAGTPRGATWLTGRAPRDTRHCPPCPMSARPLKSAMPRCAWCGGRRYAARPSASSWPRASRRDQSTRRGAPRAHAPQIRGASGWGPCRARTAAVSGAADRPSTNRRAARTPWPHRPGRHETASWDEALPSYASTNTKALIGIQVDLPLRLGDTTAQVYAGTRSRPVVGAA